MMLTKKQQKTLQFFRPNLTLGVTLLKLQGVTAMEDSHYPCEWEGRRGENHSIQNLEEKP